jgi:hypothetical protein
MLIIGNGRLITRDKECAYIENGAVACEGGTVREVGDSDALRARYPVRTFWTEGGSSCRGLLNATRISTQALRGPLRQGLQPYRSWRCWRACVELDRVGRGRRPARAPMHRDRCMKMGVTTIFDHHASYAKCPAASLPSPWYEGAGHPRLLCMRSATGTGRRSAWSHRENGVFPWCTGQKVNGRLKAMFGLHALFRSRRDL